MPSNDSRTRVAIACQGGGSHTAFTAGVLRRLLHEETLRKYKVVGLSGTSGGAVCALLAWYGLLEDDPELAGRLLDEFWEDNSATAPHDQVLNALMLWAGRMEEYVTAPALSPYNNPFSVVGLDMFRQMLERRVDFDSIEVQPEDAEPMLLIGAVDVLSGDFRTFNSRRERISADAILASAAIPNLFRSMQVDGGTYWDGLFSQNPPVRELLDTRPDELWVIQINPRETEQEPKSVVEIADRRNELAGNLSLHQELSFIEKIDQMLYDGVLSRKGTDKYKQIVVRVIELARTRTSRSLGTVSKLNREPGFIQDLIAHGEHRAEEFLVALAFEEAWIRRDVDAVVGFFADEAELVSEAPFPAPGSHRGPEAIRAFVAEHLTPGVGIDLSRKAIAKNLVTWTVRAQGPDVDPASRGGPRRCSATSGWSSSGWAPSRSGRWWDRRWSRTSPCARCRARSPR